MAEDELHLAKHHMTLNIGKVISELDKTIRRKEEIEDEFLKLQNEYDMNPSEPLLSKMGDVYLMLEQIEEDIELLEELAMYASNKEDRKNIMYGDF